MLRRTLLALLLLLALCAACSKNACQRARERLHACQMPEATFNFDGDCSGQRQRAMDCIVAASCKQLRDEGRLAQCLSSR